MDTINLRSTKTLTDYVKTTDRMRTLAKQLAELTKLEAKLRPEVLAEIGERREVAVNKQVRILEKQVKESIGRACTDEEAAAYCKAHGLTFQTRSAEYVAPATFTKLAKDGLIPDELIKREITELVIVH